MRRTSATAIAATIAIAAASPVLLAASAQAQTVYRIVGPDGRVTFSDRAPEDPAKGTQVTSRNAATGAAQNLDNLPYALRQSASRYPVVLYSGKDCPPCDNGRNLLVNRGIPFAERTVSSNEDIDAFKRLASDAGLPLLTIGNQQLKGFSDTDWSQYLDAAGYPKTSELPPGYKRPAPAPLVAQTAAPPAQAPAASEPASPTSDGARPVVRPQPAAPAPGTPSPSNPAGIVF